MRQARTAETRATTDEGPSILIDVTPLQSEHRLRGVGYYVRHLVTAIEELGDVAPVYLASTSGQRQLRGIVPPERTILVPRPHKPAQVYWMYNELALRVGHARKRPDVFLAPDFNGLVRNPFGATVAVLHDLTALKAHLASTPEALRTTVNLSDRLSNLRWRAYERKLRMADHIIAVSDSARQDAIRLLGVPPSRIHVIHHGVDHERFVPSRGLGHFAGSPRYLLHVGGRNANKNQARIVEAFAQIATKFSDLELWFSGAWQPSDIDWLERLSSRLGIGARAKHVGFVADSDLPSLYGNALAFVFPSLEEGFGLPVLEAMASGAAVITSARSSLPEVAGRSAILVDPMDVSQLADAMERLSKSPAERDRFRELGMRHAARYRWDTTARATMQVVHEAAARPGGRPHDRAS